MQASMHGADRQSRLFGIEGLARGARTSGFGRCFAHYWKDWKWPVAICRNRPISEDHTA